jgi:hypothetical protein
MSRKGFQYTWKPFSIRSCLILLFWNEIFFQKTALPQNELFLNNFSNKTRQFL